MNKESTEKNMVWVLLDAPNDGDLSHYAGPVQITVEKLRENLSSFTESMAKSLEGCRAVAGEFELSEVEFEAKLSAEVGFVLVSKADIEGTVCFKFEKRKGGS